MSSPSWPHNIFFGCIKTTQITCVVEYCNLCMAHKDTLWFLNMEILVGYPKCFPISSEYRAHLISMGPSYAWKAQNQPQSLGHWACCLCVSWIQCKCILQCNCFCNSPAWCQFLTSVDVLSMLMIAAALLSPLKTTHPLPPRSAYLSISFPKM